MSSSSAKGFETLPDHMMVEVSKDFFFEGMPLPAAIYLKVNTSSYLLIGKRGDKAAFSELHAYSRKDSAIYVKNIEYAILIQHVTNVTDRVLTQKCVPDAIKVRFLSGLADDASRSLEQSEFTSVSKIQKVSQMVMALAQQSPAFQEVMNILEALPVNDSKHSMTTCLLSLVICEEMNITLPPALEKVALGALLHDVGMRFLPRGILDKPKHLWTAEEMQTYEQHPIKAVETLRHVKEISNDVLLIIAEHHENSTGTGFPKKLRDIKISPLAKIVALANEFSNLLFDEKTGEKHFSPDQAISHIEEVLGQPYNKQVFLALKNIINKKHLADKI